LMVLAYFAHRILRSADCLAGGFVGFAFSL
jgi:hypothetical protein